MKVSKKALALVGVASAITLLAGCASTGTATTSADKPITIAFVMGAESDPFFQAMKVGAEEEAAAEGVTLIWQGDPAKYSAETQIPIVDAVLAQQPDGLVLIPTDPVALQPSVAKAIAAGIKVANVDTHVNDLSDVSIFITGDNADGGSKAADAIATQIGYKDGSKYQVVVGLTSATATTNVARLDGFKAQVAAKYPGIEVVDVAYSESNPETAATNVNNWLTKYPNLNGIFAIDGTNADGASAAIQAKGLQGKVALVGYDAYAKNVALIKSGVITALVAQVPAAEAKLAIKTLVEYIKTGKTTTAKNVVIPNFVITKDTSAADLTKYTYVQK